MPLVPASLKVWQLAQALARKTDFPFAELLDAGVVFVVVATLVVATLVDVAGAATVTVRVTVRPPELECPIAQPTTPAGTSNAKNRSQTKTSPTVTAGSRFRSAATAERYRPVPARAGAGTIRLLAAMIRIQATGSGIRSSINSSIPTMESASPLPSSDRSRVE